MGDALPYVPLGTGRTVAAVAAAPGKTCVIDDLGGVKCWGSPGAYYRETPAPHRPNDHYGGRLCGLGYGLPAQPWSGDQNVGDEPNEVENLGYINFGSGRTAKKIAVSEYHTCVVTDEDKGTPAAGDRDRLAGTDAGRARSAAGCDL